MSFDEFKLMVAAILEVDPALVVPEAAFTVDLGADSLRLVDALLRLQSLGLELSPELAFRIETVGDAYDYYCEQAANA